LNININLEFRYFIGLSTGVFGGRYL